MRPPQPFLRGSSILTKAPHLPSANATVEKEIKLPEQDQHFRRTFGVPLEEVRARQCCRVHSFTHNPLPSQLTGQDGERLPQFVRDCLDVLSAEGEPASCP